MKRIVGSCALVVLAGCVGDGVEYGGVANPKPVPGDATPCREAGIRRDTPGRMAIPDEVALFFVAAQQSKAVKNMLIRYDVMGAKALNIRYVGPPEQVKHATWQKLIRATSDYLATSTYKWPAAPGFASGCEFEMAYVIDWREGLGGD